MINRRKEAAEEKYLIPYVWFTNFT